MEPFQMHRLTHADPDDLAAIDSLLQRAYGAPSFRRRIERFLAMQPGGWVVADTAAGPVGTGGCIAYPDAGFGWIGLVATDPAAQGRGIGHAVTRWLVDHLRTLGCAAVLDASQQGASLYARMGFIDHGLTRSLEIEPTTGRWSTGDRTKFAPTHVATPDDLHSICTYDSPRFGANRGRLLAHLMHENPGRVLVVDEPHRSGFAIAQEQILDPMVADSELVLKSLVRHAMALPWNAPPRVLVPPESSYLDSLRALGGRDTRTLRHQRLAIGTLPGARHLVAAQASLGEG